MIIGDATIIQGDALTVLREFSDESVNCCVTSPPYWGLRDYGVDGQLGLEKTPEEYVVRLVEIFEEVRRVLRKDGTCWVNLGDSYYNYRPGGVSQTKQTLAKHNGGIVKESAKRGTIIEGLKEKDLIGIPWRVAFALQAAGWWLRQDIIWSKPNPMPESVRDRCTKAHEYIFLLTKNQRYYFDQDAVKEQMADSSFTRLGQDIDHQIGSTRVPGKNNGNMKAVGERFYRRDRTEENGFTRRKKYDKSQGGGGSSFVGHSGNYDNEGNLIGDGRRNKRSVWEISTQSFKEAHFATYPEKLVEPCILAGCPEGGTVLDPFHGSGTTGVVALNHCRKYIGIELKQEYIDISAPRIREAWKHQPRLFVAESE
jgi:DNA modification methylase